MTSTDGKPDVDKETVSATQVKLSKTTFTYNGKKQQPKLTVKNKAGKAIASSDYKTQFSSGCKNVGQYTVKITFSGNYKGTVTKTFKILPKGTSLKSVKSSGKKQIKVTWKKQNKQTTGYKIQYTTDKKFKKSVKASTITKNKYTTSCRCALSSDGTWNICRSSTFDGKGGKSCDRTYSSRSG